MLISFPGKMLFLLLYFFFSNAPIAQESKQLLHTSGTGKESPGNTASEILIDSDLTLEEALKGQQIPESVKENLELVTVQYYGFDNQIHQGQILVHKEAVENITEIFDFILKTGFRIEKVVPICEYRWSDEESMKDNNTSAFNYRFVSGTRIHSMHASGLAIDINPLQNPYIKSHIVLPEGAVYDSIKPGTLTANSQLVREFKKHGWTWGGDWKSLKDYQHFEKKMNSKSIHGK